MLSLLRDEPGAALLTASEMRAIEAEAMASGAVTGLELMERAGQAVVDAALAEWPELAGGAHGALVLCGPGNNGGDGFVIARLLKARGWDVQVIFYGDATRLPPDSRVNYERWQELGSVEAHVLGSPPGGETPLQYRGKPALMVDALFGTGLSRPLRGPGPITAARRVAVDVPSGLCADSGRRLGDAMPADLTVTFHRHRLGHMLAEGPDTCGKVVVADIGLTEEPPGAVRLAVPDVARLGKAGGAHKYGHGHALVLAGGAGHGGAARLAARAALRVGAGLVTLVCPPPALAENAAQLTAVMLRAVGGADALAEMIEGDRRISALCLGPGLGVGEATRQLAGVAVASCRPLVLDADALTSFADAPGALFEAIATHRPQGDVVLTPHDGEFARLFPDIARRLAAKAERGPAFSRVDAARAAAGRARCVVLLKGPDTVIAAPDGRVRIHAAAYDRAAPWLATAGSGDVLAGLITGLLARGFPALQAAGTVAWLHAEAARSFGPGLIAEDLPEELPRVFRGMGL